MVQRAVVVTFVLVLFFVPVGPGVLGNRHSSTPPLAAGAGWGWRVRECGVHGQS